MDEYKSNTIKYISEMMKKKGKGKSELARLSGIPQPRFSSCMSKNSKNSFTVLQLIQIADALDCSLDELVGRGKPSADGMSDHDLCMIVTDMLASGRAKMTSVTVTEEMYLPGHDDSGYPEAVQKTGENRYPCIYFPGYRKPPKLNEMDEDSFIEYDLTMQEFDAVGNIREDNQRLNIFLKQLYNLCLARDVIGSEAFRKIAADKMDECKIDKPSR